MKLFLVGSDKIYAIENFYVKYLRQAGVEVCHFPAQSMFYDYYQKNIPNKVLFKSGLSNIFSSINKAFKLEVEKFKPDIIWVFKGMEIFPCTLQWAKSRNIKLVNYNGDSPFIFSGKGSGNSNVTKSIPLYDLFLTYNREDKSMMEESMGIHSEVLPFGYDLDENLFSELEQLEEINRVCFLGNPDEIRAKFLTELAQNKIEIDVYGHGWNRMVDHGNINICAPVYGNHFWRTLRKYRVQLNLLRPHNLTTHNMRTFEAGGVGAIQLAPDTPDHQKYFEETEEIFLYNDIKTCLKKIDQIMSFSFEESMILRKKARSRSIRDGYAYKDRSQQALKYLKELNVQ